MIFLLVGLKEAYMLNFSFLRSYFTTSPGGRPAGRPAGRLEESKIRLTQPSLAGTGAELGNIYVTAIYCNGLYYMCKKGGIYRCELRVSRQDRGGLIVLK